MKNTNKISNACANDNENMIHVAITNESEITSIGKLIKSICIKKGISYKKLCRDICSESFFSEFIQGKKSINLLMLDLIFQRAGRSEDDFQIFLMPKEYKIVKIRFQIIDLLDKKEVKKAKQEIEKYKKFIGKNDKFHDRFLLIMEARIMQIQNEDKDCPKVNEKIYLTLKKAVEKTVPGFEDKESFEGLVLAYSEMFFMVDCIKFRKKVYNDGKSQKFYKKIIDYIEKSDFDYINRAKIYPKVVCLVAKNELLNNEIDYIKEKCDIAIDYLRKSQKLYFMKEILETKSNIIKVEINSIKSNLSTLENIFENLDKLEIDLIENEEYREFLTELFNKHNLSQEPFEWYHHNHVREVYNFAEVIKRRMDMKGVSIEELSKITGYDIKTIKRVASEENAVYPNTAKKILKGLGMFEELQMYAFDCDSYDIYKDEEELSDLVFRGKYDEAYKIFKKFKKKINPLSRVNQQYFGQLETLIQYKLERITYKSAIKKYIKALEITLPKHNIFSYTKKFFTKIEITLIYNISMLYSDNGDNENALKWLKVFNDYYEKFDFNLSNYIITYELVMSGYESVLGDIGEYKKSDEICDNLLRESLKCRRGAFISNCLYSPVWNMKDRIEKNKEKMQSQELALYKDRVEKALMINCIMNNEVNINFLKDKLKKITP